MIVEYTMLIKYANAAIAARIAANLKLSATICTLRTIRPDEELLVADFFFIYI
jgi:hypothetical protein